MKQTFLFLLIIALSPFAHAQSRGTWFWGSTSIPNPSGTGTISSPWGSNYVVGNCSREISTINFLTARSVDRIYGSYGNRPVTEPLKIASWNYRLHVAGIESQILLEETAVNDPAEVTNLLGKITSRLINFNNSQTNPARRFKALHLDIEPQQLAIWTSDGVGNVRRALLDDLLDSYIAIRNHLDTAGFTTMPIYADINFSWDKLPVDGGSILWADAADRDGWYTDIATVLDGVSVMTFSKTSSTSLQAATLYERTGPLAGKAIIGMQPKTFGSGYWANITDFNSVMTQLESDVPLSDATDLENYAFWRHATPTGIEPACIGKIIFAPDLNTGGGVIILTADPGYRYSIYHSPNLEEGSWKLFREVQTEGNDFPETIEIPVRLEGASGFYKVGVTPQNQ